MEHFSHLASIVLLLSKRNELYPRVKMCFDKYRELQDKPKPLLEEIQEAKSLREVIQEACQILEEIQEDEDQSNECFNPTAPPLPSFEEVAEESGEVEWTPNQMTVTVGEEEDQSNECFNPTAQLLPSFSTLEEKTNPAQKRVTFALEDSTREEADIQGASPLEQLLRDCSYEQVRNIV